jgi:hypothetical protein
MRSQETDSEIKLKTIQCSVPYDSLKVTHHLLSSLQKNNYYTLLHFNFCICNITLVILVKFTYMILIEFNDMKWHQGFQDGS